MWRSLLLSWPLCAALAAAVVATSAAAVTPVARCEAPSPLRLQAERLQREHAALPAGPRKAALAMELGQVWSRLGQWAVAEPLFEEAAQGLASPAAQAAARLEQGNVRWARRDRAGAQAAWSAAAARVPQDRWLALAVELNRLRDPAGPDRATRVEQAHGTLRALQAEPALALPPAELWRWQINLAARAVEAGAPVWPLAEALLNATAEAAAAAGNASRAAEALDALSDLQERRGQAASSLATALRALALAPASPYRDLSIGIEARIGRLSLAQGDPARAAAAFRRAVAHIEAARADIPITYEDGSSSFRETLMPVYLGLTEALLARSGQAAPADRVALLREARGVVELSKQSEMEDYLLDRCAVKSALRREAYTPPPGTAVLYPIMLPDRLELLVETAAGLERYTAPIGAEPLQRAVMSFVAALRNRAPLRAQAERLYRSLVGPVAPALAAQGIHTIVWVPDGVLRLLPLAALHDGREHLVRRYRLATVPAMQVLGAAPGAARPLGSDMLLAGLSEPGPVVQQLSPGMVQAIGVDPGATRGAPSTEAQRALAQALALPGVKAEVETIAEQTRGRALVDQAFTVDALRGSFRANPPAVLHIASHGVFGDSADSTFLMAYDRLITLDALQDMLRGEGAKPRPLDLITLSACQTVEGDDRAPLGMSGVAIKAQARAALGTLWPVSDQAALFLMTDFYRGLGAGQGKAQALRAAQEALLARPGFQHPFFWAAFTLVGDWQ
ncbi:MAG: CHAT domain-containing protein [Rubrivivax sp.]